MYNRPSGFIVQGRKRTRMSESEDSESVKGHKRREWFVVLLGLWVIVTPFFLGGSVYGFNWLLWSNLVTGILIAIFAGFVASR